MTTREARALVLYGTTEAVEPTRTLTAGGLTAELEHGNLRNICWHGVEVIRAIGFVIRDTNWGTLATAIERLQFEERADGFRITYTAALRPADGSLAYDAEINGRADGTLSFHAVGSSRTGFPTCRTGFVVLHPLEGVVGRDLEVGHTNGGRSRTTFPLLIDPFPPATEIRELIHHTVSGLSVAVRFEGDAFEMEDHRNWTDASFKTYVRPLSRGYPYRIEPGTTVEQSVNLAVAGTASARPRDISPGLVLGSAEGEMPAVGLFLPRRFAEGSTLSAAVAAVRPGYIVGRLDFRDTTAAESAAALARLAAAGACPLELELVIPGVNPGAELSVLKNAIGVSQPAGVFVIPQRDLKSRAANNVPAGEATPQAILAAARAAFPAARVGGGMPCGFPELNRNRPPAGIDFATHATQATYHAADDRSVMETLEAVPHVIRATRAIVGNVPYRLGPATIGLPEDATAGTPAANPELRRVAMAEDDPRQRGLFAAAFAVGYAAAAAREGIAALALAAPVGKFGVLDDDGRPRPLAAIVSGLAALGGMTHLRSEVRGTDKVASLAAQTAAGPVLWLANLSPEGVTVAIPESPFTSMRMIDAAALATGSAEATAPKPWRGGSVTLDAYAVCRLSAAS